MDKKQNKGNNKNRRIKVMEENQKINCTVESCVYQDAEKRRCTLQAINVMPTTDTSTRETDESMCGSYEYDSK